MLCLKIRLNDECKLSLITTLSINDNQLHVLAIYRMQKNSLPNLHEVIGWKKSKIYWQGTICQRCILSALWSNKLGLTKVGNQAK
jgi:hypothetical protein